MTEPQAVKIAGQVQPYQWGGREFLPALLGYTNTENLPQAEYWLGAHPSAPAMTIDKPVPIDEFLVTCASPPLRFLLKILDVRDMLSIQAHPNKKQALDGFARENALGIALDSKNRNYKDASDKPELMVALSEFWLLHGFRQTEETSALLTAHECLAPLGLCLQSQNLFDTFALALDFSSAEVQRMQNALAKELCASNTAFAKNTPEFWIRRWLDTNPAAKNGILTLFFLNLVRLKPGMAVYQPAGLLHAYLEGQNVELMANSDNVLRAGLTPKHIDVAELLRTCSIAPSRPQDFVITPQTLSNGETRFVTPFDEFELAEISAPPDQRIAWTAHAPEIVFCYRGSARLQTNDGNDLHIQQGDSVLLVPGTEAQLHPESGGIRCFKARNLP